MKPLASAAGVVGALLILGGLVAYTLAPDQLWLTSLLLGGAVICLIAFFVLHFETVRAFSARRSTRLGLNSILMVVLFIGILVILNFLTVRHSARWDFSEGQHFTLAPQTFQVLRNLKHDVNFTVFTQERSASYNTYRDLLEGYRQASDKVTVEFVDPERKPAAARQYGITRLDTAVIESGGQTTRVTAASEAELTGAIVRVSRESKKRILFLEGHGEHAVTDQERNGLSVVKEALTKQGYEVAGLSLFQETAVPDNTAVLVLAGPTRSVTAEEQDRIVKYVGAGGHVLVMLDPDVQSNLEKMLAHWGVEPGKGVLVDLQDRLAQGDLTALLVRTFTEHDITQDLTSAVLFPMARHLVSHEDKAPDWEHLPLARTSPRSWAETDLKGRVVSYSAKDDIQGPLPIAIAITPKKKPEAGKPHPAVVVVGNSSFAMNGYVRFPGNTDFFLHTVGWLAEERDLVSLTAKDKAFRPFIPNATQERLLLYVQVLLLPTLTFLWGMTIWRKRRRL
jgi:ABC-type uncharacterized transport system involved in gliding motility auxiliary subunit